MSKLEIMPNLKYPNLKCGLYWKFPLLLPLLLPLLKLGLGFFVFLFLLQTTSPAEGGSIPSPIATPSPAKQQRTPPVHPVARRTSAGVNDASLSGSPSPDPLPTSAAKPRRSPALGDTFVGAGDLQSTPERKRSGRERERKRGERAEEREKKGEKRRERVIGDSFYMRAFQ